MHIGAGSTALGANGGNFILGKGNNVATKVTGLIGKVATGSSLVVKNPSGGSALGLSVGDPLADPATKTVAPMKVDSQARVANLNADKLDGKEPGQLPGSIASVTTINTFPGIPFDLGTNSAGWKFVGDPVTGITTTSSQKLVGAAEVPLGDPTATSINYDLCHRPSGGGTITPFTGGSSATLTPNDVVYTATSSAARGAGTSASASARQPTTPAMPSASATLTAG